MRAGGQRFFWARVRFFDFGLEEMGGGLEGLRARAGRPAAFSKKRLSRIRIRRQMNEADAIALESRSSSRTPAGGSFCRGSSG